MLNKAERVVSQDSNLNHPMYPKIKEKRQTTKDRKQGVTRQVQLVIKERGIQITLKTPKHAILMMKVLILKAVVPSRADNQKMINSTRKTYLTRGLLRNGRRDGSYNLM